MPIKIGMTLEEFIVLKEKDFPNASGSLSKLLRDVSLASKLINREVNKAGLVDIIGAAGTENIQGEQVQKLDLYANNILISFLKNGGQCAGIASEEEDSFVPVTGEHAKDAHYVVLFDPLDGSSNIDVNAPIGTIFAMYKRKTTSGEVELQDFLQAGKDLVASGYVIYGSSTMLVFTTGNGVNGFTLDPSIGEFCLSHPNIKTPETNNTYSINQGSYHKFMKPTQDFVDWCSADDKATKRPFSARYIGSMVADFHRNLLKGGIFMYPAMQSAPNGKLRLMYECNPMAFIQEQAGGIATTGTTRILDIPPTELHQRVPIVIGSKQLVEKAVSYYNV